MKDEECMFRVTLLKILGRVLWLVFAAKYDKGEIDQLEMVQRTAARFVNNKQRNTSSVDDMLQHLNWCSLEDRRKDAGLVIMYKIKVRELGL
jgi:hypothetical protein